MKKDKYHPGVLRRPFESLSPKGQRIRIAQDVIARIERGQFTPRKGWGYFGLLDDDFTCPLTEVKHCQGCALGGLFSSWLSKHDPTVSAHVPDITIGDNMAKQLAGVFETPQLGIIERAFEQSGYVRCEHTTADEQTRAAEFGRRTGTADSPRDRLLAIMKNIVDNHGTFVP
jgi:hypothetical protein